MSESSLFAALCYLLPGVGPALTFALRRDDHFAQMHARQALLLLALALAGPLIWLTVAFLLAWLPTIGPLLGIASFGLVIAVWALALGSSVVGVVRALQGRAFSAPLIGQLAERAAPQLEEAPEPSAAIVSE